MHSESAGATGGRLPVKAGNTSESEEGARHEATPRPHLLRLCMTGSLASHLLNYSRLSGPDLSVSKELVQLSRSKESPCGTVSMYVWPCSLLSVEWLKRSGIKQKESVLAGHKPHFIRARFHSLCILLSCKNLASPYKMGTFNALKAKRVQTKGEVLINVSVCVFMR